MPLSEHEQRLLEQIERSLLDEDPKFASAVRASDPRHHAVRRVILAGTLFLVGVGLLVLALVTKFTPAGIPILGIAAFVVMFFAALFGVQAYRKSGHVSSSGGGARSVSATASRPAAKAAGERMSLLDRLEQRWRRRNGGDSY